MSRTRIVKGKIYEKVGGDLKYYSESNISETASQTYAEQSSKDISHAGEPTRHDNKISNSIKGLAIFRRKDDYKNKPDFGFDWYAGENYGTTYTEPFEYESLVLDGLDSLKREYTSFTKYLSLSSFGYIEAGKNGKSLININEKIYYTPWFSGFAKDEHGNAKIYELDVFFDITEPAEGDIRIKSENENIDVVFIDDNSSSFKISENHPKQFKKTIKISFLDYITEHTTIVITFHKKSEEQKAEEKKWEEDKAAGKTDSNEIQTVYVTPGQLMGILNIYKNSKEFDLKVRYVKVHFNGWVRVDGYDEKIYLSKRNPPGSLSDYHENNDIEIKIQRLEKEKSQLEIELIEVQSGKGGWFSSSEETLKSKIAKKEAEIIKLETENKNRLSTNKELGNYQSTTLETKFSNTFLKKYEQKIKDTFAQALINFIIDKDEYIEADFSDMDDDLYLKKNGSRWELMEEGILSDKGDAGYIQNYLEKKYRENNPDYNDTLVFFVPFDVAELFGKSEGIFSSADNVIIGPAIIAKKDWITIPHEVAHSLGLAHSFPDMGSNKFAGFFEDAVKAGHLFREGKTENVMDYIYGDVLVTFWKWQWDRIHNDTDDMKAIDKSANNETK